MNENIEVAAPAPGAPDLPPLPDAHAELRRLASKATPGPWEWSGRTVDEDGYVHIPECSYLVGCIMLSDNYEGYQEDCDFMAAANPARILALLDEVANLRAALAQAAPASPASAPVGDIRTWQERSDSTNGATTDMCLYSDADCWAMLAEIDDLRAALAVKVEAQQAGVPARQAPRFIGYYNIIHNTFLRPHELAATQRTNEMLMSGKIVRIYHPAAPLPAVVARTGESLLRPAISATNPLPPGCYCKPGECAAPRIMGRQTPCRDPQKRDAARLPGTNGSGVE